MIIEYIFVGIVIGIVIGVILTAKLHQTGENDNKEIEIIFKNIVDDVWKRNKQEIKKEIKEEILKELINK